MTANNKYIVSRLVGAAAVLFQGAALLLFTPGPAAAQEVKPPGYTEKVEVNVRTVLAVVTDEKGKPIERPLSPQEVEVLEDGVPAKVLGVDPIPATAHAAKEPRPSPATEVEASAASRPIEAIPQIFYLDASLLQARGVQKAALAVEKNLAAILPRGPLAIVVADPEAVVVVASTTDAGRLRLWLKDASAKVPGRDRLGDVRKSLLEARSSSRAGAETSRERIARTRASVQQEIRIVQQSLERLEAWVESARIRPPAILYLANDGFDIDPTAFYISLLDPAGASGEEARETTQLRAEFSAAIPKLVTQASDSLAREGVTAIPLAVGGSEAVFGNDAATMGKRSYAEFRQPLSSTPTFLFVRPLDALRQIADATGGEVVTQEKNFALALDRLRHAVAITYRMSHPPDGRLHRLEVRSLRPDVALHVARSVFGGSEPFAASAQTAVAALQESPVAATLPVELSIDLLDVKPDKRRVGEMHAFVDLSSILEPLEKVGPGRMRATVAVQTPGKAPFIHHEEIELVRESSGADWTYEAPLEWPPEARRLALTVEELKTGTRGVASADLPSPDGAEVAAPEEKPAPANELPLRVELLGVNRHSKQLAATLRITIGTAQMAEALTGRAGRIRVQVLARFPANPRVSIVDGFATLHGDTDTWSTDVPVRWSADVLGLTVMVTELATGMHASAVLEPSSWK